MTGVSTTPFSAAASRRATRQRWVARAVAGVLLVAALGYASLPLWLPTNRLRRQLEDQLSADLGAAVRIANVRAGWLEGVVIEDLTIADRSGNLSSLARIGRIRCDLSPFAVLTGARLRELEIMDPQIWLRLDETGQLVLPAFGSQQKGRLPSLNYSVRGLTCHVIAPSITQSFRIDRLDLQLDPPSGLLHLASVTRVKRPKPDAHEPAMGRLDFDANIRIPRLKKSERLNGRIEVEWSDLALNDLPVPLISHVPVEQVDGTTSGRLTLDTHPDLGIDYSVAIAFDGVSIMRPDLHRPAQVPDAELTCGGHWDPTEGVVVVKDFVCETPALKLTCAERELPALRIDENGDKAVELCLRGTIKDWRRLRKEVPELDQMIQASGADLEGQATFVAEASRGLREDRLVLTVDAQNSRWSVRQGQTQVLTADPGMPKSLRLETIYESGTHHIRQPVFALELGDTRIEANGEAVLPAKQTDPREDPADALAKVLVGLRGEATLRCGDAANLKKLFPLIAAQPGIDEWSGPFDLRFGVDPQSDWSRIHLAVGMGSEAVFRSGDMVRKGRGRDLQLRVDSQIPYASQGRVDLLNANLQYGAGRLELASHNGSFDYRLNFGETISGPVLRGADGEWRAELRLRSIEDLIELTPVGGRALKESGITFLAGPLEMHGRTEFSYQPGDTMLRTEVAALADDLAVRWKDRLTKRAGEPVRIEATHRLRTCRDGLDQYWAAVLIQPAGSIRGGLLVSQDLSQDPAEPLEFMQLSADFDELADGIDLLAPAADQLHLQASGGLSVQAGLLRLGDRISGRASVDLGKAVLADSHGLGVRKAAGIPLGAHVGWEAAPVSGRNGAQRWTVDCRGQLGGAVLDGLNGTFVLSGSPGEAATPVALTNASFQASGTLAFDEMLGSLQPRIRHFLHDFEAAGEAGWRLAGSLDSEGMSAAGELDLAGVSFSTPEQLALKHAVFKDSDRPLSVEFDVTAPRGEPGLPQSINVEQATLRLGKNRVSARGKLNLAESGEGRVRPVAIDLKASLPQLADILECVPTAPLETLEGGLEAEVAFTDIEGALEVAGWRAVLDGVLVGPAARPLRLDGSCKFNGRVINLEQLDWRWGESSGALSGRIIREANRYDVRLGFGGRQLMIEDLLSCAGDLRASLNPEPLPDTGAAPPPSTIPVADVVDLLRRSRVRMDGHVGTMVTPLPLGIKATVDAGWQELTIENRMIAMDFGCLVDGGQVNGQVVADLSAAEPKYRLTYTADRIQPGSVVDDYLRRTFPGMVATGPLTLIDETVQKLMPAPGEPNPEIGKGELIIDGGTVSGRAAPMWMARIFPGLNLSSFEFTRLHSWFDKTADRRVHHQMIYQGDYYNVYMIGWSNPEGFFQYEVGIDFLAGLESEYWANTGQGRVPLFTKTGQVRTDGSLADETVNFVSFRRVLETLFVRNNPVITAYHAVRKRVLGKH